MHPYILSLCVRRVTTAINVLFHRDLKIAWTRFDCSYIMSCYYCSCTYWRIGRKQRTTMFTLMQVLMETWRLVLSE